MNEFRCPLCAEPLYANVQGLACAHGHQFDRAKEGYFNLLPVQKKNSKEPGDAKAQLQARRQFLEAGFFDPLKNLLLDLIPATTQTLLDIGCGEGYFTRAMATRMTQGNTYGVDIAKAGIRLAAKSAVQMQNQSPHPPLSRIQQQFYAVASAYDLPFADHSMDVITRVYAPSRDAELYRVIKPGGLLVIVAPAENHLLGLRQRIYTALRPHTPPVQPMGFTLVEQHRLNGTLSIGEDVMVGALLSMTPFAWKIPADLRRDLQAEGLKDQFDFSFSVYRPLPENSDSSLGSTD